MLPLERQVDILARLTERSRAYFDLYKFIEGAEHRPKILDQMNEYLFFFEFQGHILRYALIVELGALFEKQNDSVCIHAVLKRAKPNLPHDTHSRLAAVLNEGATTASKISVLRNKAFAHRDAKIDFDVAFKMAAVTLDDIEELIENGRSIVDELCEAFDIQMVCFTTEYVVADSIRLFRKLGSDIAEADSWWGE